MSRVIWLFVQILPIVGFASALLFLAHVLRQRRSPSSTMAWLLAIVFIPYVGVPLYIMLGGRKVKRVSKHKVGLDTPAAPEADADADGDCVYPCRLGNAVSMLPSGEDAFKALMEAIESASESIDVTTYILGDDSTGKAIIDALTRRLRQGVRVRLIVDALGSRHISSAFLADFREAGGRCVFFMPMIRLPFRGRANLRNHRKIVLIDGKTAMIGGMNLAREYMGPTGERGRWHDLSLVVRGPAVADLYRVFRSDWAFAAKEDLEPESPAPTMVDDGVPIEIVPSGPDVATDYLHDKMLTHLFSARERIWIVTPYFIPDEMLEKALCIAAARGVDVRVVVPRVSNHRLADLVRRGYLRQIQAAGGDVRLFTPGMLHAKVILIDDAPGIIGSMNMDVRSFFLNFEIALFAYSPDVVAQLARWVEGVSAPCEAGVKATAVPVELLEDVGRLLAPLL